jgi:hypothetical protein
MGMRSRREVRAAKAGGRCVGGGARGRKPFSTDTVNGEMRDNSVSEVGMVVWRGNVEGGAVEPMLIPWKSWNNLLSDPAL